MTPDELTDTRKGLGLTQSELGDVIGRSYGQISRMEAGTAPIQAAVSLSVRALAIIGPDPSTWPDRQQ
jgi:predicted transcriptional regulator